jgi:iron complex outermembrane receptor protein
LFAQANWLLSDHYTLVTGARHSKVVLKSTDQCLTSPTCAFPDDGSGLVKYQATNPVLGLTWHAHPNWNFYANTGRGFETPTLAESAYSATSSAGPVLGKFNTGLKAALSRHHELGAKYAPGTGSRLNLAVFEIQTQNEIVTLVNTGTNTAYQNATQTLRQGVELSWQQYLDKSWRAETSLTAMRAVYEQPFGKALINNRLPATPDRLGYAALHWSQNGWGSQQTLGWFATFEWMGRSRLWANDSNADAAGGYALLNIKLRHRQAWAGGTFEPYVGIDNLQDKKVIGSVIVNQYSGGGYYEPALPRTWVLGLQAKWAL